MAAINIDRRACQLELAKAYPKMLDSEHGNKRLEPLASATNAVCRQAFGLAEIKTGQRVTGHTFFGGRTLLKSA